MPDRVHILTSFMFCVNSFVLVMKMCRSCKCKQVVLLTLWNIAWFGANFYVFVQLIRFSVDGRIDFLNECDIMVLLM